MCVRKGRGIIEFIEQISALAVDAEVFFLLGSSSVWRCRFIVVD